MTNLALTHAPHFDIARQGTDSPDLSYGDVARLEGAAFFVRSSKGMVRASRAASCLLDPQEKDKVLLAHGDGEAWVLAVLVKYEEGDANVTFPGTVRMRAPEGGIHMSASTDISISSARVAVRAEEASAVLGTASLVAKVYKSCVDNVVTVMEKMSLFCGNARQHFTRSYKRVDGHEVEHSAKRLLRADTLDIASRKTEIKSGDRVGVNARRFQVN